MLNGRKALVTGGANGIGRAIVERFAADGATVAAVDVEPVPDLGPSVVGFEFDLRQTERLEELLDEVLRRSGGEAPVPAVTPSELRDDGPLDQPVEEEFRVGTMALAWDPDGEQVVIEAQEVTEGEEDAEVGEDDPAIAVLRVRISAAQARAFAERALEVVAAGRPPCPLCGLPLDSEGHVCPRQNGYLG